MEFFQVIQNRCSMRAFLNRPVEPEKLQQILKTLNCAPSAGNMQAYEVYIADGPECKTALSQAAWDQESILQAPLVLVFCKHPELNTERYGERGRDLYALQDATIACTFAMLAASALGLSSVWVGAFDAERVRKIIGASDRQLPVAILPVGYAGKQPPATPRRSLKDLIHYCK